MRFDRRFSFLAAAAAILMLCLGGGASMAGAEEAKSFDVAYKNGLKITIPEARVKLANCAICLVRIPRARM